MSKKVWYKMFRQDESGVHAMKEGSTFKVPKRAVTDIEDIEDLRQVIAEHWNEEGIKQHLNLSVYTKIESDQKFYAADKLDSTSSLGDHGSNSAMPLIVLWDNLKLFKAVYKEMGKMGRPTCLTSDRGVAEGSFITVNGLSTAGLVAAVQDKKRLNLRKQAVNLWETLTKADGLTEIKGPPGMGKSSEVWGWACSQEGQKILWLHMDPEPPGVYVFLGEEGASFGKFVAGAIDILLPLCNPEIVIADGALDKFPDLVSSVRFWQSTTRGAIAMLVYSQAAACSLQKLYSDTAKGARGFTLDAWTLDEQKAAGSDFAFAKSVIDNFDCSAEDKLRVFTTEGESQWTRNVGWMKNLIEEKWDTAGPIARWMFGLSLSDVETCIDVALKNVSSLAALLQKDVGKTSPLVKNHLLMSYPAKDESNLRTTFMTSRHISRLLLKADQGKSISIAYQLGLQHKNPAFLGWVTEFEVHHLLEHPCGQNLKLAMFNNGVLTGTIEIPISGVLEFDPKLPNPLVGTLEKQGFESGHWLRPKQWNQAGYDLARWNSVEECLDFFQVTRGASHRYWSSHFKSLVDKINAGKGCKKVRIYYVFPHIDGYQAFIPTIQVEQTGSLREVYVGDTQTLWGTDDDKHIQLCGFKTTCWAR